MSEAGEPYVIPDPDLKYLIMGALSVMPYLERFPVVVRSVIHNRDADGVVQSFTIVTGSGLRFTVRVDYDGQTEDGADG